MILGKMERIVTDKLLFFPLKIYMYMTNQNLYIFDKVFNGFSLVSCTVASYIVKLTNPSEVPNFQRLRLYTDRLQSCMIQRIQSNSLPVLKQAPIMKY